MNKSDKFAAAVTGAMATWTFIVAFLIFCAVEIILNRTGLLHFDPTTVLLNLLLSLMAAVQGSIIMIAQKQVEARANQRDQETHDAVMEELQELKEIIEILKKDKGE